MGPERVCEQERRVGVDIDGSVVWREVGTRLFSHYLGFIRHSRVPSVYSVDDIPVLDHTPVDTHMKCLREKIAADLHFRRTAIPGMVQIARDEIKHDRPVHYFTGRRATQQWYDLTEAQFVREGIPFTGIYMKPKGVSGLESKADGIRALGITDFYEDDKATVFFLRRIFPNLRLNYIDHGDHLTEKELADNRNITVIPIRQLVPPIDKPEESVVRNSKLRSLTDFVDPTLESLYENKPFLRKVKAWHVTALGAAFSIAGIGIAEHQNRVGKHPLWRTVLAGGLCILGATLDLLDGKWARLIRSKMIDEKAKKRDEDIGDSVDPLGDGFVEAFQAGSSAYTAWKRRDRWGVRLALGRLATTNLPRTAKAIAGCFGIKVPETYSLKNVLHGDIRPFGTSLDRKIPNYSATFVDTAGAVPVQKGMDAIVVPANVIVATERVGTLLTRGDLSLSKTDIRHAKIRTVVLGLESLVFLGAVYFIGKKLLAKQK